MVQHSNPLCDTWAEAKALQPDAASVKEQMPSFQLCQPDLGAGEDCGAIHPECAHQECEGQPEDQAQPAQVHERQVLLDQPDLLL